MEPDRVVRWIWTADLIRAIPPTTRLQDGRAIPGGARRSAVAHSDWTEVMSRFPAGILGGGISGAGQSNTVRWLGPCMGLGKSYTASDPPAHTAGAAPWPLSRRLACPRRGS